MEAVRPGRKVSRLWDHAQLVLMIGNDFGKLVLNVFRVDWLSSNIGKSTGSLIEFSFLHEVTRGLRKQKEANAENNGPEELDSDGDSV